MYPSQAFIDRKIINSWFPGFQWKKKTMEGKEKKVLECLNSVSWFDGKGNFETFYRIYICMAIVSEL